MKQFVSIITPSYNSSNFIKRTINSVCNQTFQHWELIIVDDCSTDDSRSIIKSYVNQDSRIKLICLEKNSGVATARNTAIDHAKGDYIAFLDSDDYWHPQKLEKQIDYFQKYSDIDVVFSEYYRFNSRGILGKIKVPDKVIQYNDLLKGNCIGNLTGVYKRQKFFDIRQKKIGAEDYLFWLEIFFRPNVKGVGLHEPLAYYRVAEYTKSLSSNKFKSAKWTWDIYYKSLSLPLYKVVYLFLIYIYKALTNRL